MLPPPPRLDTVLASDSATNITLVSAHAGPGVSSSTGLPIIPGYEVLEHLGRGGMGRVFKARHLKLDRIDAIKMVAVGADETVIQRLIEEAKAIAKLKHPNIAQVYDSGEVGGQPFYAMELLEGGTLSQKLAGKPISAREAAELVMTLARAVGYFHQQGILHRDLKPGNVLLTSKGELRIADFGLVKHLSGTNSQTQTGDVMGSPSYMAPEQATGQVKTLGPTVDVYALGAILYECLTGRPPFQTPEAVQTLMMVITLEPIPPRQLVPKLPKDINTICLKCLEKQPGKRYQRAEDLAEELRRFLEGEPIVARPVGRVEKAIKWCKRRPAWAALIVAGLLTLLAFGLGYWKLNVTYVALEAAKEKSDFHFQQLNTTFQELEAAKRESDLHLAGAGRFVSNMLYYFDDLSTIPKTEVVREQVMLNMRELYRQLLSVRPSDLTSRAQYAETYQRAGDLERTVGKYDKAREHYNHSFNIYQEIIKESLSQQYRSRLLQLLVVMANHERDAASELYPKYLGEAEKLAPELSKYAEDDYDAAMALTTYHNSQGQHQRMLKQITEAEAHYRKAIHFAQRATHLNPMNGQAQESLSMAHNNLATILLYQKKFPEAAAETRHSIELLPKHDLPRLNSLRARYSSNEAVILEELKRGPEADKAYREAVAIFRKLMLDFPQQPDYRYHWIKAKLNLARSLMMREPKKAPLELLEIKPVLDQLIKDYPQQANYKAELKVWQSCKDILEIDFKIPVKQEAP
ncbi:MAG: protein kinase [Gemmatales bacterium]